MFNAKISDQAYIYPNRGHGFLDPVTGVLIWIGAALILIKKNKKVEDIFILSGFMILWFVFTFILGQAPNYTRLFLIIPFIALLSNYALKRTLQIMPKESAANIFYCTFVIIIILWNASIFKDFAEVGLSEGNDVGGTGRYVEERKNITNYSFYLLANKSYPYYSWGSESEWLSWIKFFTGEEQYTEVINPQKFNPALLKKPFTVFMSNRAFKRYGDFFDQHYNDYKLHNIKPDGSLVAVEVSS